MKKILMNLLFLTVVISLLLVGCYNSNSGSPATPSPTPETKTEIPSETPVPTEAPKEPVTILVAAAASLEYSYTEKLIPMFREKYPWITVEGTYDSSGKLQTQIEAGLDADIFMSAAMKQMDTLADKGLVDSDSVVKLLENRIVLIAPVDSVTDINSFDNIPQADTVALGDPESVPVGQYSKEALTSLGIWDEVSAKASFGTNVTEVLNWVAEGSADIGIVYATDAAATDKVKVLAEAPDGSLAQKVIYPIGIVSGSTQKEAALLFVDFLSTEDAFKVFEEYGFSPNK